MKKSFFIFIFPLFVLLAIPFSHSLKNVVKTSLLISELMPGAPKFLTNNKDVNYQKKIIDSSNGKVVADIFSPKKEGRKSALIIATGVKIAFQDRPNLYKFAKTMSKLGYVVVWPKDHRLDKGENYPESPETFISTFKYLQKRPDVDPKKISFLGFSTGSSISFIAASDPRIAKDVHSLLFFGGYYNAQDFIASLKARSVSDGKQTIKWTPSHEVLYYTKENFKNTGNYDLVNVIENKSASVDTLPQSTQDYLKSLSPSAYIHKIRAPVFIVHAYTDDRIPYIESQKLEKSLPAGVKKDYLLTRLFDHVRPKQGVSLAKISTLREVASFFKFSYDLIAYL